MIATAMAWLTARSALRASGADVGEWSIGPVPIIVSVVVDVTAWSAIAIAFAGWP